MKHEDGSNHKKGELQWDPSKARNQPGRADRSGSLKSARKAKKQAQGEPDSVHRALTHRESLVEPSEQRVQREGKELKGKKSQLEAKFDPLWKSVVSKYADPESLQLVEEHPFAKEIGRRFRFDRCHMTQRVAVEIMGGTWSGGRHTSPQGYEKDCEKLLIAMNCSGR